MDDKPRLRPIEAFPVQQDGKTLVYLKDPLNFATPLGISPVGYFVLAHFDGQHSFTDIQEAYCKQFGSRADERRLEKLRRHARSALLSGQRTVSRLSKTRWCWNFAANRRGRRRMSAAFTKRSRGINNSTRRLFLAPRTVRDCPIANSPARHRRRSSRRTSIFIAAVPPTRGLTSRWLKATAPIFTFCSAPRIAAGRRRTF